MLGRTMHGISYDPIHDEFTVPQQFAQSILTFRGGANGEEAPIRVIQGSQTKLRDPDRLDVDPIHNEIYVPMDGELLVFPRDGNGNVAPIRTLKPAGEAKMGDAVAVDTVHNLLVVAGSSGRQPVFMVFNRTDEGTVKPRTVIGGPKSGLRGLGGPFAVYAPKGWIIASVRGGGEYAELASDEAFVGIWNTSDNGDVPPKWTIGGPYGVLQMPRGITLDPKNKNMMVSDKRLNAVLTFSFPEMF